MIGYPADAPSFGDGPDVACQHDGCTFAAVEGSDGTWCFVHAAPTIASATTRPGRIARIQRVLHRLDDWWMDLTTDTVTFAASAAPASDQATPRQADVDAGTGDAAAGRPPLLARRPRTP